MYVRGKLNNLVHYPLHGLDMRPFLSRGGGGGSDGGGGGGGGGEDDVYDLFAAVHHIGTMNGGHYVASCRVEKTNGDGTGDWYNFNDSHVSKVDEKSIVSATGYILFYKRRELSSANVINLSM